MRCLPWRERNQRKAGIENAEFLKGEIENIPLPDNSVDVVISNCVINLSADKDRVLRKPSESSSRAGAINGKFASCCTGAGPNEAALRIAGLGIAM